MFAPRHTYQSVAKELADGLTSGRVVLPNADASRSGDGRPAPGLRGLLSQGVFLAAYLALGVASLGGSSSVAVVAVSYVLLGVSHYASMARR